MACSEVGYVKTELTVGLNDTKSSATNKQKIATDRSCSQFLTMEMKELKMRWGAERMEKWIRFSDYMGFGLFVLFHSEILGHIYMLTWMILQR